MAESESKAMQFFNCFGMEKIAWSLRRLHCPVSSEALVLEVGSGGNPYARANVLLDAYETTRERHWAPLATDRPTVLGFVENLPFKDQAFDFVIAAHVLEHSADPERFLSEIQRVAKAGYIEVPDAFLERINPYRDHRLEITCRDHTLVIRKKKAWRHDPETVELYEDRVKPVLTRDLVPKHPFEFHVRYFWENRIAYKIVNPEVDAGWPAPTSDGITMHSASGSKSRELVRDFLRKHLSQRRRNASIELLPLLRCTTCHSVELNREPNLFRCVSCGNKFPIRKNVVAMNEGQKETA